MARERAQVPVELNVLTRTERENALDEWLREHGGTTTSEIVPALVNVGFVKEEIDELMSAFHGEQIPVVAEWFGLKITIYSLVGEIGLATGRIVIV